MRTNAVSAMTIRCLEIAVAFCAVCGAPVAAQQVQPTVFAPGVISGPANDLSPAFTPDGRTVFFTRANSSQSVILVSHLSGGTWSKPEIAPFSGTWRDLEPTMAPDGSYLIFASNRPATAGGEPLDAFYNGAAQPGIGGNLWRVDRTANGWGEPHRLPDVVNVNGATFSPSIAANGNLYFMKPTGAQTLFHIFRKGNGTSLFISMKQDNTWTKPAFMGAAISPPRSNDIESRLGADHRTLYFSTRREVPTGAQDGVAAEKGLAMMEAWNNGLANIWEVSLDSWLGGKTASAAP